MEADILKNPWIFSTNQEMSRNTIYHQQSRLQNQGPQLLEDSKLQQQQMITEPESILPGWEENFQDLTGWSQPMQQTIPSSRFAPQIAGESIMSNHGTKFDNEVLTHNDNMKKLAFAHRPRTVTCGKSIIMNNEDEPINDLKNDNINNNNNNVLSSYKNDLSKGLWELPNNGKVIAVANKEWTEFDVCASEPPLTISQESRQIISDINYMTKQQSNKDIALNDALNATGGSDDFDLLSYLACDDDIPSPCDSLSTSSSHLTDPLPSSNIIVSPRTCEPLKNPQTLHFSNNLMYNDYMKHSPSSSYSADSPSPTAISISNNKTLHSVPIKVEKDDGEPIVVERRSARANAARKLRTWVSSPTSSTSSTSTIIRNPRTSKSRKRFIESDSEDEEEENSYKGARQKNNEASRRSRMNKKAKEIEMSHQAVALEKDNKVLRMKVEELEKLVTSMRNALLRSAIKRQT